MTIEWTDPTSHAWEGKSFTVLEEVFRGVGAAEPGRSGSDRG